MLCHTICCAIQSQVELGIEPVFWPDAAKGAVQATAPVERAEVRESAPLAPAVRQAVRPMVMAGA